MATRTHGSVKAFDLNKEDWTSYAERLGHYFIANDVTAGAKKREILLSKCGLSTYKLLRSLVGTDQMNTMSYDDLVAALKNQIRQFNDTSSTPVFELKESQWPSMWLP